MLHLSFESPEGQNVIIENHLLKARKYLCCINTAHVMSFQTPDIYNQWHHKSFQYIVIIMQYYVVQQLFYIMLQLHQEIKCLAKVLISLK